jgi:hypothetical protein
VIRTVVSIDADLASSLAIRFACQLGSFVEMEVTPVYVKEFVSREEAMGAGWASRTWEREIIDEGKQEIAEMIATEKDFCPVLTPPRVICGNREAELLKMSQGEKFDLFVEGVHFSWNSHELHKNLRTKLHQRLAHPLVLVRALRKVTEVPVVCLNVEGTRALVDVLKRIWRNCPIPLRLISSRNGGGASDAALSEAVSKAAKDLEQAGCTVSIHDPSSLGTQPLADALKDCGLTAIAVDKSAATDRDEIQWLARIHTSALVTLYGE